MHRRARRTQRIQSANQARNLSLLPLLPPVEILILKILVARTSGPAGLLFSTESSRNFACFAVSTSADPPRFEHAFQPGDGARSMLSGQRMLPDSDHPPPFPFEQPGYRAISLLVAENLRPPEVRVVLRPSRVSRTSMPKAAVDKDSQPLTRENKIGFACDCAVSSPPGDAMRPKNRNQSKLGIFVTAAADEGHNVRTLLLGKDVRFAEFCFHWTFPDRKQSSSHMPAGVCIQEMVRALWPPLFRKAT